MLVAGAGGAIGVALGWAALNGMLPLMPDVVPSWVTFHADARFTWFAVVLTASSALFAGLWPALEYSRADLRAALAEAAPRTSLSAVRRRGLNALVIGEVALALVLLSAGGLVLKAFHRVVSVDPGFRARSCADLRGEPALHR